MNEEIEQTNFKVKLLGIAILSILMGLTLILLSLLIESGIFSRMKIVVGI